MPDSYNTEEAIGLLTQTITVLKEKDAKIKEALAAVEPLLADNADLKALVDTLREEDAKVDAKLGELAAALAPEVTPEPEPETPTEPEVPAEPTE